jgi:hypothetical protein
VPSEVKKSTVAGLLGATESDTRKTASIVPESGFVTHTTSPGDDTVSARVGGVDASKR